MVSRTTSARQAVESTCRADDGLSDLESSPRVRAPCAPRAAKQSGRGYVIVDGTLIHTDRLAADRPYYQGKHHCHGMNLQAIADPDGNLLWISGAIRGSVHDTRAARIWQLPRAYCASMACSPWATRAWTTTWWSRPTKAEENLSTRRSITGSTPGSVGPAATHTEPPRSPERSLPSTIKSVNQVEKSSVMPVIRRSSRWSSCSRRSPTYWLRGNRRPMRDSTLARISGGRRGSLRRRRRPERPAARGVRDGNRLARTDIRTHSPGRVRRHQRHRDRGRAWRRGPVLGLVHHLRLAPRVRPRYVENAALLLATGGAVVVIMAAAL